MLRARLERFKRLKGEPVQNVAMFERAWEEFECLREQPQELWVGRAVLGISELDRYEIGVITETGDVVGGLVLAPELSDPHVGACMSIITQYVNPEYRGNTGLVLMREAMRIARDEGYTVLAWSHMISDWEYRIRYYKLKGRGKIEKSKD